MGVSLSTAKWLGPLSWVANIAAQVYGIFSSPNMKQIHDAHIAFFSPLPIFVAVFFMLQQIAQATWMWRISKADARNKTTSTMLDYMPFYVVGNLCLACWMMSWNQSNLVVSDGFVLVNTTAQLYYIARRLPPMDPRSADSVLTHVVSQTLAGISVLDLLHNTSAAFFVGVRPSTLLKAGTGVGVAALSVTGDWIFGGCLVYDLAALSVGQHVYGDDSWSELLGIFAVGAALIVTLKNVFRPSYQPGSAGGYHPL